MTGQIAASALMMAKKENPDFESRSFVEKQKMFDMWCRMCYKDALRSTRQKTSSRVRETLAKRPAAKFSVNEDGRIWWDDEEYYALYSRYYWDQKKDVAEQD